MHLFSDFYWLCDIIQGPRDFVCSCQAEKQNTCKCWILGVCALYIHCVAYQAPDRFEELSILVCVGVGWCLLPPPVTMCSLAHSFLLITCPWPLVNSAIYQGTLKSKRLAQLEKKGLVFLLTETSKWHHVALSQMQLLFVSINVHIWIILCCFWLSLFSSSTITPFCLPYQQSVCSCSFLKTWMSYYLG